MAEPRTCPNPACGRPISSSFAARCPACGQRLNAPAEQPQESMLRRPDPVPRPAAAAAQEQRLRDTLHIAAPRAEVLGPICRSCGHPNPPARVRCESCAAELWPGTAAPQRPAPPEPPPPPAEPRSRWLPITLAVVAVLAVMAGLYLAAYALTD